MWRLWPWRINGQLPNTKIHYVMPLFRRWLLNLSSKVQVKRLCLFVIDNTNYFGCDCTMCYFMCVQGFTFKNVVIKGSRWLNTKGPCAQLCTLSSFQCGWPNWPIFNHGSWWFMMHATWASFNNHHYIDVW
jgi:hypothetical protein